MSFTGNAHDLERVAWVPGHSNYQQFTKFGQQRSQRYSLQRGQVLYFYAEHVEGYGGDHLSVGLTVCVVEHVLVLWSRVAHYRCAGQIDEAPSFGELSSTAIKSPYQSVRVRQSYSPERQTLRIVPATGDAFDVSGTYTLTMAGHTTAPIRYNASEDEFRGVLEDMHTTRCDYLNDDSPTQRMYVVGLTVLATHTPRLTSRVPTVST